MVPYKGHIYFLEAASKLAKEYPHIRFFIIGQSGNGYGETVRQRIDRLALSSRVSMFQYDGNIFDIMNMLDIFVHPSFSESLPLPIVEAMWAETPVIATRITGIPEAVKDGQTGFLVPAGDSRAIYDKLKLLVSHREFRERMGERALRFARERFSTSSLLNGVLRIYTEQSFRRRSNRG
jgi:glycosyltransferase involved in cell wall biosynthesis